VSSFKKPFVISFVGLKKGKHLFEFEVTPSFFENREYSPIDGADLVVKLELDKKETMMIGQFFIEGSVSAFCGRCTDSLDLQINTEFKIVYKFGNEESDDEALVVLAPEEYELDLEDSIYELIVVSLPLKMVHPLEECNQEMMASVEKYTVNLHDEEEEDDSEDEEDEDDESPWSILKDFK
jgi:uncharacterized metal-binding protein YceD (DUF177 family)